MPSAILIGVVFGLEFAVEDSVGLVVEVGGCESPQADSRSSKSMRNGKPNRKSVPRPGREGDRKGTPLLYTPFGVALYLLVAVGLANVESLMKFSSEIASSIVIRSEVSLIDRNPKHSIVDELLQAYFDERVLPVLVCIAG